MLLLEGFRSAVEVRKQFSWQGIDPATWHDLNNRVKLKILLNQRVKESDGKLYCIPTVEDAVAEVNNYLARLTLDASLGSAFARYLRTVPLFLIGPLREIEYVSHDLVDHIPRYGRGGPSAISWHFLESTFLSVNARHRKKLVAAAKTLIESESYPLDASTARDMRELIKRKPVFQKLEKFDGYSLSVKSEDFPDRSKLRSFLSLQDATDDSRSLTNLPPKAAREGGLRGVFDCFNAAFPNGKTDDVTWNTVEKRSGYSRRHIVRAIKKYGGQGVGK